MTKQGHLLLGFALSPAAFIVSGEGLPGFAGAALCIAGATAPDWLEVPFWRDGVRFSAIPHRRVTHWLAAWAVALPAAAASTDLRFLAGFALGGLAHCLADWLNPAGVPVLNPWRRSSLRWKPSGEGELTILFAGATISALALLAGGYTP